MKEAKIAHYSVYDANINSSHTSQAIRNVNLEFDVAEEHREGHGKVPFSPKRNVSVPSHETIQGQDSLTEHFSVLIVHAEAEHSEIG